MASEIPREIIYGNFKPKRIERLKEKHRDKHDDREGNDSNG